MAEPAKKTKSSGGLKKFLFNQRTLPYWLLAPSLIFVTVLVIYPVFRTIFLSMTDYKVYAPNNIQFVGLKNFKDLFTAPEFKTILSNSVVWLVGILLIQFTMGMIIALIISKKFIGRRFFNALLIVPWVTPGVVAALMWSWLYNGNYGAFNHFLYSLGITKEYIAFLADKKTALYACMLVIIWQGIPFFAVTLSASIMGIPSDLYEAAKIDGASGIRSFIHVTLPLIKDTIFVSTMLRIIWITNNVDTIVIMTGGGPGFASRTLAVHSYLSAQQNFKFGYASAVSLVLATAISLIAFLYMRALKVNDE